MNVDKCWNEALPLLEKALPEAIYNSMIMKLTPVHFEDNILVLEAENFFFQTTINSRYLFEITRCVHSVADIEDLEVKITCPEDADDSLQKPREDYSKTNLRQKYTFDTFVKGKSNELAFAAAQAVAEAPGESSYNPLFLYGGVGLGKTHLIQSIGNYIFDHFPEMNVLYQSTENFTNELIKAIRERTTHEFKLKYRGCDILLLDDIQFLERTVETQEEMFHTFNTLYNVSKQIVLTSDLPPKDLINIEDRLTSRFSMGLVADVSLPDYETRTAILEKKLSLERLTIPHEVKEFIIRNVDSNIRDLEGALNKVTAYARLTNMEITMELTQVALKDQLEESKKPELTIEYIQETVAKHFNLTTGDLNSKRRTKNIVFPRQIAMYICRKLLEDASLPQLGVAFGGRDHTTVMHSCEKISGELEYDKQLQDIITDLEKKLQGESYT